MLTPQQVRDAFPSEKPTVDRLIQETKSEINGLKDWAVDVRDNEEYDEKTRDFLLGVILTLYLKPLVSKYNRLERYFVEQTDKTYDTRPLERAKEYPIDQLFEIERARRSPTKTICCCPLPDHRDDKPSFCIYHSTNTFYCFSCHRGGDTLKLVEIMHGLDFRSALQYINNI